MDYENLWYLTKSVLLSKINSSEEYSAEKEGYQNTLNLMNSIECKKVLERD